MKEKLTQEAVFTVEANGQALTGMRVVSRWNGLIELQDKDGAKMIVSGETEDSDFARVFSSLFVDPTAKKESGVDILMISPSLAAKLQPRV